MLVHERTVLRADNNATNRFVVEPARMYVEDVVFTALQENDTIVSGADYSVGVERARYSQKAAQPVMGVTIRPPDAADFKSDVTTYLVGSVMSASRLRPIRGYLGVDADPRLVVIFDYSR